jgi:hypothetical protein
MVGVVVSLLRSEGYLELNHLSRKAVLDVVRKHEASLEKGKALFDLHQTTGRLGSDPKSGLLGPTNCPHFAERFACKLRLI